jgi:hypothetical protein
VERSSGIGPLCVANEDRGRRGIVKSKSMRER